MKSLDLLLAVIRHLSCGEDVPIHDTIWMPLEIYHGTAVEALCEIAGEMGATDEQIDAAVTPAGWVPHG